MVLIFHGCFVQNVKFSTNVISFFPINLPSFPLHIILNLFSQIHTNYINLELVLHVCFITIFLGYADFADYEYEIDAYWANKHSH